MSNLLNKIISDPDIKLLLDSIYDGVYIVNQKQEIVFWNKGAERITGYHKNEVHCKKCSDDILNHIDANGTPLCTGICPLQNAILNDNQTEAVIYPLNKEKKRFPVLTRVSPIKDAQGSIVGAIEVFHDVSKEQELQILRDKFDSLIKKFVSATTYKEIIKQAETGSPENSQYRDLTVLYVDVVGFTAYTEKHSLQETAEMLNDVFSFTGKIINENHGDIDKFIGDAIMAIFVDANDAVLSAEKILNGMREINDERFANGKEKISIHIGINSGTVMQVEIGTSERKDITIIGDAVNIAARIEELSEPDSIFISESTYSRIKDHKAFAFYEKLAVKGRKEPIQIFKSI